MGTSSIQNENFSGAPAFYPEETSPPQNPTLPLQEVVASARQAISAQWQRLAPSISLPKFSSLFGSFAGLGCGSSQVGAGNPYRGNSNPDIDGDGIPNEKDACPKHAGVPSDHSQINGCPPDKDRDGIVDAKDACPDVPGVRSENPADHGCPVSTNTDGWRTDNNEIKGIETCPELQSSEIKEFRSFDANQAPQCSAANFRPEVYRDHLKEAAATVSGQSKFITGLYNAFLAATKIPDPNAAQRVGAELLFAYDRMFVSFFITRACNLNKLDMGPSRGSADVRARSKTYFKEIQSKTLPEAEKSIYYSHQMAKDVYETYAKNSWSRSCVPAPIGPVDWSKR